MNNKKIALIVSVVLIISAICYFSIVITCSKFKNNAAIENYNKLLTKYSTAISAAIEENGTIDKWKITNNEDFFKKIEKNLDIKYVCKEKDRDQLCFFKKYYRLNEKSVINVRNKKFYKFTLEDGTSGAIYLNFPKCDTNDSNKENSPLNHLCGSIWIDVNGTKKPNVYGRDLFQFLITKDGTLLPRGCEDDKLYSIEKHCSNTSQTGDACGAWILKYGNMNYLR